MLPLRPLKGGRAYSRKTVYRGEREGWERALSDSDVEREGT